jgi:hypothetical protein
MPDIVTTITISLRHCRQLTEAEFKNLVGNILAHIQEEHDKDPGDWGFAEITEIRSRATQHDENGDILNPIHGPVTDHLAFVCAECADAEEAAQ